MNDIVNQKDIKKLIFADDTFASINDKYGSPPNWTRPQGFISLSKIILEQQVSLASGNAHFLKLNKYLPEFTPTNILNLTDKEMKNCHISRQKSQYLRALSSAIIKKGLVLEELQNIDDFEVKKQLTKIKGIGDWTADIYLMFCLKAKDIFPVGDIAVANAVKELCHTHTKEDMILLADKWRPLRSLASYFFWHYYLKNRNRSSI